MTEFRCWYTHRVWAGMNKHAWFVEGEKGAVHLHISDYGEEHAATYGRQFSGGVEFHSRTGKGAPQHPQCDVLHAPCWHDGSSLMAEEQYVPMFSSRWTVADNELIWRRLQADYRRCFDGDDHE